MVQICSIEIYVYLCPVTDKHIYTMKRTWTVYFGLQSQAETKEFQATIKAYTLAEASLKMTKWLNDREFEQHPEVVEQSTDVFNVNPTHLQINQCPYEIPMKKWLKPSVLLELDVRGAFGVLRELDFAHELTKELKREIALGIGQIAKSTQPIDDDKFFDFNQIIVWR